MPWWIFCLLGFQVIISHMKMRVQLDYTSHTCINLHVYNDESRYYLTEILREKTLLAPGFKPATFPPASSSLQPSPSLQVFRPPPSVRNLVPEELDLVPD